MTVEFTAVQNAAVLGAGQLVEFVPGHAASFLTLLLLGLLFSALTLAWLVAYSAVVARVGDVLRRPSIRRALDALTGAVLVALGVRLSFEHRS